MKKLLLSILTLTMSAVAMADDVIVLDSMYHKKPTGEISDKYFYVYDDKGNQLVENHCDAKNKVVDYVKNIYENGLLVREESYTVTNDETFLLEAYSENKNFVDGYPTEVYTYYYEPIAGEYIGDIYMKIQKMQNGIPVELIIYEKDEDGKWVEGERQTSVLNDKGQITKSTTTIAYDGMEINEIITYEYDDHGYQSKMTFVMEMMGMELMNQTSYYENEYGIYDGPIKITHYLEEEGKPKECTYIEEMYYGNLTGIRNILAPSQNSSAIYDLMGRKASKAQRGIVIQNGRKSINK